ncbi:hypothetical protein [Salinisphaera sp. Q1T1-3]|uniref:hypothetical protein n=1 Tax=Salinisphaera sp. Q1T1-3 TaxID=2321229 RepID=UPI0011C4A4C7|nr:hypothetical protein [Salinisphaera sp. Q1T1-3]
MGRLILIGLAIFAVFLVLRRIRWPQGHGLDRKSRRFESTVRCVRCGAYVARRHAETCDDGPVCRIHATDPER